MTEEDLEQNAEEENSSKENGIPLSRLLGMKFENDGTWSASDTGNSPIMRRLNRKERRSRDKKERKKGK